MLPNARGFDYFFGMHSGSHDYFPKAEKNKLFRNKSPIKKIEYPYLTDWFTQEAIGQMTLAEKPFFCFLSLNTPHTPMQAKEEDLARFSHLKGKSLLKTLHTGKRIPTGRATIVNFILTITGLPKDQEYYSIRDVGR
jgi:hypothetical protein